MFYILNAMTGTYRSCEFPEEVSPLAQRELSLGASEDDLMIVIAADSDIYDIIKWDETWGAKN